MNALGAHPFESRSTILVVEDDHDIRVSMRALLEEEGYKVVTVTNGLSALSVLEHSADLPSLILLDLMLPVMDGWHFADRIRLNPRLANIPIVIVSAYDDPPPPQGVSGFIKKPLNTDTLLSVVSAHCD